MTTTWSGHDTPAQFWPYAVTVLGGFVVLGNAASVTAFIATSGASRETRIVSFVTAVGVVAVLTVALLAAAVVRRLHDRGRRGAWALVPLVLLVIGFALQAVVVTSGDEPGPGLFLAAFAVALLYFATLLTLIVQLALPRRATT